ncbi:efflux RND transporter permease subunit [Shigella flexneri]
MSATYPGADAKTVQDTVTQVIEQNMNGIDNLMYMSSTVTQRVRLGISPDLKIRLRMRTLRRFRCRQIAAGDAPAAAGSATAGERREIVRITFLMVVGVINTNGTMTQEDISDYVGADMKDAISRTSGVG